MKKDIFHIAPADSNHRRIYWDETQWNPDTKIFSDPPAGKDHRNH